MYKHGSSFGKDALVYIILVFFLHQRCDCQDYSADVEWSSAMRLIEYKGYKSVSLTKFIIPEGCTQVIWDISAEALPSCPSKNVFVYIRHGSYPLATPYNETYPANFHVKKSHFLQLTTNNISLPYPIQTPRPGPWFLAGFLPRKETKVTQAGLSGKTCAYGMGVRVITKFMTNIEEASTDKKYSYVILANKFKTLRLIVPEGTVSFSVTVDGCTVNPSNISLCPLTITAASSHLPNMSIDTSVNCSTNTCHLKYMSPVIKGWNYITVIPHLQENITDVQFNLQVNTQNCFVNQFVVVNLDEPAKNDDNATEILNYKPKPSSPVSNSTCVLLQPMGRFDVMNEDFLSVFIFPDQFFFPFPNIKLYCPDKQLLLTNFDLLSDRDAGGTLKILFTTSKFHLDKSQDAVLHLCIMKDSIPSLASSRECADGLLLTVNTTSESATASKVYIPYPEGGRWYLGINSMCINKNRSEEACISLPIVSVEVFVTRCVDNTCGGKGNCKEFISGMLLFSSCDCLSDWQGYGCTDGSRAESDGTLVTTMLLLTLSNAFFIPGIFFSIKRRMFVEGLVYVFTMFFSTFYHACDVNNVKYTFCMMDYGVLSFCDFYGSIMSFWVTLLAMSRLNDNVRSFFHMLGALSLALGVEYNKHGLWVFIAPALTGVVIMSISWVVQCRKRKECYPTKWRYLKFILPGILLAGTGLVIFAFLETEDNYKYTHSAWHVVIALSIVFLLPSRKKSKDDHQYSLVQSNHVEAVGMMSADGTTDNSDDECILQPNLNRPQPDWNVIL